MSLHVRTPDATTVGGRLKMERERLRLSQPAMAALAGMTKGAQHKWENGSAAPNADALAAFAQAGADVQFIITGNPRPTIDEAFWLYAEAAVRHAISPLAPSDRRRLLMNILAGELEA